MAGTNPRPREGRLNSKDDAMSISNESVLQKSSAQSARSGMALVIVLGLIALLVISSITFAIMMRIERASSANARNTTMARQTAKSALAYAIAAIDQNIGTNRYPHWDKDGTHYNNEQIDRENLVWRCPTQPRLPLDSGGYNQSDARTNYFWKDTFGSADHKLVKGQESRRAPARLFTDQMARYLSKGIRHRAYAQYYSTPDNLNKKYPEETRDRIAPEWVPMTGGTNIINMNNVIGRYAFMAFNTSGYLDIPAICADGPDQKRGFGSSASEIVPVSRLFARQSGNSGSFRIGNDPVKKLKEINNGRNFGTVAEILALNNNGYDPNNGALREYFADGAAYSAFNFSAPDRIPTNVVSASDYNDIFANGRFPFKNKICIGGDGDDEHIKSLKRHKAAIMAGFWMSGLTASTRDFEKNKRRDISDAACSDSSCTVCGGKAGAFTLKKDKVSEQALWAYLGLIDYADKDDEPAYDDSISFLSVDEQKFARPVTEAVPLFNGFMTLISITREEVYEKDKVVQEADPELGLPEIKADVFDGEHVAFTIEVNGKTAFSYQLSDPGAETADGDAASEGSAEGKLGVRMEGGDFEEVWAKYAEKIQSGGGQHFDMVKDGTDVFFKRTESFLDRGAFGFDIPSITVTNDLPEAIGDPMAISSEDKEKKMIQLPEFIYVCAAGSVKTLAGVTVNRVPGDPDAYDSSGADYRQWLTAYYDTTGDDGGDKRAFADEPEETGDEVYSTDEVAVALKRQGADPDYKIKKRTVNFVIWGEKIDPRFACLYSYSDAGDWDASTLTALSSHCPESPMYERRLSELGIEATDRLVELMGKDKESHSRFEEFREQFKSNDEFFGEGEEEYFIGYSGGDDPDDWTSGYSAFQREFLTDGSGKNWLQDEFKGVVDSVSWPGEGLKFAGDMDEPFHQMVVRNDGIDTAGELGWLPIGPYATIRLCGYEKESEKFQESEIEKELSLYNALPSKRPFHNVLDFFSGRKKPVRGLVNINSTDPIALASVFNGMAVNDEEDSIDGFESSNLDTVDEKTAESLGRLLAKTWHHVDPDTPVLDNPADDIKLRGRTSMLGWMFDCLDRNGDEFENNEKPAITGFFTTNARREAAIRNSCGLFSTRGVNLSIIVRGEAFTPFFGRSDVRNDLGTTLASRAAYAQIWRDTEPDDDGNYPYFVQFFKIFDE